MTPKILLVTSVCWPSAARIAASFAGAGCAVDLACPEGHPARESRYVNVCHNYTAFAPQTSIHAAIAASAPHLIVPCDDRAIATLVQLHRRIALSGSTGPVTLAIERSLGDVEKYSALISRTAGIEAASDLGVCAPMTLAVGNEIDLDAALAVTGLPAMIKSDGSWGGTGVLLIHTMEEARTAYRELATPPSRLRSLARAVLRGDAHFLREAIVPRKSAVCVQQFVPGQLGTTAFACWEGRVLAATHTDVMQTTVPRGPASVLKRVENVAMDRAARLLAQRFYLSGLHGLDYIRDADGVTHLIEVNPRATQTSALALGAGHDLAAALASQIAHRTIARAAVTKCDLIALFPQEWSRDPASPYLASAYHDVPWDDTAVLRSIILQARPRRAPYGELVEQLRRVSKGMMPIAVAERA